ncbi:MAG: TIM barrel protein [Eubacteriales bacterium]|nr:TIM barrel protein [Eubacteriales bacterium]
MEYSICVDSVFDRKVDDQMLKELAEINKGIEFWTWWDRNIDVFVHASERYGIKVKALCTPFISLTDKLKREEFIEGLSRTIEVCKRLHCKTIISQVGNELEISRKEQHDSIVMGLRACREILEKNDIILTIEPLNTVVDHKEYYLYNSVEGFEIIKEAASPNIKLLYDIYHMQIMEGNILDHMKENLSLIGHIHIAGVPGRHEILENELDYQFILKELEKSGYQGTVGLEYFPLKDPMEGIKEFFNKIQ